MENKKLAYYRESFGFSLNISNANLTTEQFDSLKTKTTKAHQEMKQIESGAIKNPDEGRQVTHFTDRMEYTQSAHCKDVEEFFVKVRSHEITSATDKPFDAIIINGIGGSALGPQLLQFAIKGPYWNEQNSDQRKNALKIYFTDNTDPAGLCDALKVTNLETTLAVSISKSGGTKETKNNLTVIEAAFASAGIPPHMHSLAVTMKGSKLDIYAKRHEWLKIWPMAESIGGRTSETAIVGHIPAAAAGIDFTKVLDGACQMDTWTREEEVLNNPAYMLASTWYLLGEGRGDKNMVIVPYSDRLVLLSRYLQQLVMESIGKEFDLNGNAVYQGLNVFGNKGGTDAHAFIQQLNDGRNDFFITFIEVLEDAARFEVGGNLTMGDYLHNFMQGLSNALVAKNRPVLQLTLDRICEETVGMLIALYERAVAYYAELVEINAFHQPGVEAYKKLSSAVNEMSLTLKSFIEGNVGFSGDATTFAAAASLTGNEAEVEGLLRKFEANKYDFNGTILTREFKDGAWFFNA